jgi:signal transduction histidine kinase
MTVSKLPYFDYNDEIKKFESLSRRGIWIKPIGEDKFWVSHLAKEIFELEGKERVFQLEIIRNMIADGEFQKLISAFKETIKTKKPVSLELKLHIEKNSSRHSKYVKLHLDLNRNSESKSYIIGTIHDITLRKKKQDELKRQKEKLENSDKIKTNFLANLSYEIRNPMNTIIGFTELMNLQDTSEDKKKEYSNLIIRQSKELLSLVDDILELSKFESGQITISKNLCNIPTLFHEVQEFFLKEKKDLNKDSILIIVEPLKAQMPETIYTDPGRLQQVLSILLDNALSFTEKGSVTLGCDIADENTIIFSIKDTGIGISKDEQKTLFQRFKQVDFTTHRKLTGSGLGLVLAKYIIEMLGGKIWVESETGSGATFYFSLPLEKPDKLSQSDVSDKYDESSKYNWKNKVILVVDDEEVNFKFIEAVLSNTHSQVIHAENGRQAIDLCQSINKIDLILMDLKMPHMSGYDALSEIKKIKNIPIIAQSAYALSEIRSRSMMAGFDDYIIKPIDIKAMLNKLNKYLVD